MPYPRHSADANIAEEVRQRAHIMRLMAQRKLMAVLTDAGQGRGWPTLAVDKIAESSTLSVDYTYKRVGELVRAGVLTRVKGGGPWGHRVSDDYRPVVAAMARLERVAAGNIADARSVESHELAGPDAFDGEVHNVLGALSDPMSVAICRILQTRPQTGWNVSELTTEMLKDGSFDLRRHKDPAADVSDCVHRLASAGIITMTSEPPSEVCRLVAGVEPLVNLVPGASETADIARKLSAPSRLRILLALGHVGAPMKSFRYRQDLARFCGLSDDTGAVQVLIDLGLLAESGGNVAPTQAMALVGKTVISAVRAGAAAAGAYASGTVAEILGDPAALAVLEHLARGYGSRQLDELQAASTQLGVVGLRASLSGSL